MNKKVVLLASIAALAVTACVSTLKNVDRTAAAPPHASSREVSSTGPSSLVVDQILADSSSGKLGISNARIITDNDEAFNSKMAIIEKAKANLYLTYFIYSNDYSSSLFNAALIKKAQSGTKIKLLVDLTTNYNRMDLFRMLEAMGGGNIEVRFYNKPSPGILKIALMTTIGCSEANMKTASKKACDTEKKIKVESIVNAAKVGNASALMAIANSRLFLAAYYAKSKSAAVVSVVGGQSLDLAYAKNLLDQDKAHKSDILGLVKSGNKYRIKGSISDGLAASNFNKALGDLTGENQNFLTGVLPLNEINSDPQLKKEYDHWTDYNHQKLIAADVGGGSYIFETGGRNIEDSYHLKTTFLKDLKGSQKYLFKDTEFYGEINSGGDKIAAAFLRNWNFKEMVATTAEINDLAPFDLQLALQACKSDSPEFKQCVGQVIDTATNHREVLAQKAQDRVKAEVAAMQKNAADFTAKYLIPTQKLKSNTKFSIRGNNQSDFISKNDLESSTITFIENLNAAKDTTEPIRVYGTTSGNEANDGRYISDLWLKGMENACTLNKPTQVILHSAYLMPPSNMIRTLGKMLDGTWDCHQVQIRIITNSFETTDLNVINILAQSEMQAIFQRNAMSTSPGKASLKYYEYAKPVGQSQSLHTKLSVLGDDMIIGSANADVRSYYMDSNTGVYIHNALELTADYTKFVDSLVQDGTIIDKTSSFGSVVNGKMVFANYRKDVAGLTESVVDYWISRSSAAKKESIEKAKIKYAKDKQLAMKFTDALANEVYSATNTIMAPPKIDDVHAVNANVDKCIKNTKADVNVMKQIKHDVRDADGYSSQNERQIIDASIGDHCEQAVKQEQVESVDPSFNLKFEAF
ncbi:MAG: phospholipase D-like domain-containing protein [Pseudobdellovibrio sp.]